MLESYGKRSAVKLCAHNGQEFDYPYIARRCLINGVPIPKILDIAGAKHWEVKDTLLDTLQLWKFGDYKHFTSLDLLCAIFEIPTPKDDIDGSQVAGVYWRENDLDRIIIYCEKDVFALAQLFLRYQGKPLIPQDAFERVA
jgi:3'-5' exonuclease